MTDANQNLTEKVLTSEINDHSPHKPTVAGKQLLRIRPFFPITMTACLAWQPENSVS